VVRNPPLEAPPLIGGQGGFILFNIVDTKRTGTEEALQSRFQCRRSEKGADTN